MENERNQEQDQAPEHDNVDVTELEDKDLEDASGGTTGVNRESEFNINCNC
jgi:hypothetical protein